MRFGLDRMRRMMTALGSPQQRLDAIHVLGTNGKTSTDAHDRGDPSAPRPAHGRVHLPAPDLLLRTGADRRARPVGGRVRGGARTGGAGGGARQPHAGRGRPRDPVRTAHGRGAVRSWPRATSRSPSWRPGLGGRYDATSVIDAPVTVLTNVGLEHTRWLGPTLSDIAEEKLAVVRPGGTLVLGSWLAPEALSVAERVAGEREARIVRVRSERPASCALAARGPFQRRNFALARAAAEAHLRGAGIELDERPWRGRRRDRGAGPAAGRGRASADRARRRAQPRRRRRRLCRPLPEVLGGRAVGLVMGVLEDKDAAGMLATLLPVCERAWFTAPPSPRALSPAALQSLARQLDSTRSTASPSPAGARAGASLGRRR